jgi:hypothetical protein
LRVAIVRNPLIRARRCLLRATPIAVTIFGVLAIVGACDTFPTFARIGVSPSEQHDLEIHYLGCPTELVYEVELAVLREETGSRADLVIWQIRSEDGSAETVFPVGQVPAGFAETVSLSGPPPSNEELFASVETTYGPVGVGGFRMSDLEAGTIRASGRRNVEPAAFEDHARTSCQDAVSPQSPR